MSAPASARAPKPTTNHQPARLGWAGPVRFAPTPTPKPRCNTRRLLFPCLEHTRRLEHAFASHCQPVLSLLQPWISVGQQLSPRLLRVLGMDHQVMHPSLWPGPYWLVSPALAEPGKFTHNACSWGAPLAAYCGAIRGPYSDTPRSQLACCARQMRHSSSCISVCCIALASPRMPSSRPHRASGMMQTALEMICFGASSLRAARRSANVFR